MSNQKKEVIIPLGGAKPLAPYSSGLRFGNLIYTSEQIGLEPTSGKLVTGGLVAEIHQALQNIAVILKTAGSSLENAIKVTVFLKDIDDYQQMNDIYGSYFSGDPPVRSIIQGKLPGGASVGFDVIAFVD